jgi:7,8-dihydropterin-6-yl-methyl-4-(beta-D-ribofuranosyl)aminobenzene 5'-phosphate synthase
MIAEHGYSARITVRRGRSSTSVLFDAGLSPDTMITNADRLGLDLSGLQAVVLSHGALRPRRRLGGLACRSGAPRCRWSSTLWSGPDDDSHSRHQRGMATVSKRAPIRTGFEVTNAPSRPGCSGSQCSSPARWTAPPDSSTALRPGHQHWTGATWESDPLVLDDQALVVQVRANGSSALLAAAMPPWLTSCGTPNN